VTVAVNAGRNPRRAAELRDRFVDTVSKVDRSAEKEQEPAAGGQRAPGRVSIVGGGPGDPGLITVTGLRRLREADVVVADRLAPLALLEQLAPGVQVVDAAKVPGGPAMRQDHINQALVEHARAGRAVVRLKGGDPFVFGRGREEVEACLTAGVPVEVVPGVTSAISVPAAAGIPVTHRGVSQGFCVLAGHVRPGDSRSSVDWVALARSGMTLVLLMSIDHLAEIADTLISAGLGGGTPGAVVSDGWSRQQRVVTAPLRDLADAVRAAGVTNPAVVVIGDVAALAASGLGIPGAPPSPGGKSSPGGAASSGGGFGPAAPVQPDAGRGWAALAAPQDRRGGCWCSAGHGRGSLPRPKACWPATARWTTSRPARRRARAMRSGTSGLPSTSGAARRTGGPWRRWRWRRCLPRRPRPPCWWTA
jgi:uroporphyrin-III C-methyltransferase/precorrin-2 dehydrogenase/sirohydrochlorin ferrochelatase